MFRVHRTCSTCCGRCSSRPSPTATCAVARSSPTAPGWVERIVTDAPETSTYFTPLAITLNIDSFEHLEFETRPDQLLEYVLVQGDERVIVEFAPIGAGSEDVSPFAPRQLEFDTSDYVQMELLGLEAHEDE